MSGGYWYHKNDQLKDEIFGYYYEEKNGKVKIPNVFEDKIISEIVWDTFQILKDYDLYKCGDTCEETWLKSKKAFKDKWLKTKNDKLYKDIIDNSLEDLREELYKSIGIDTNTN